jgi:hypothetical protein
MLVFVVGSLDRLPMSGNGVLFLFLLCFCFVDLQTLWEKLITVKRCKRPPMTADVCKDVDRFLGRCDGRTPFPVQGSPSGRGHEAGNHFKFGGQNGNGNSPFMTSCSPFGLQ